MTARTRSADDRAARVVAGRSPRTLAFFNFVFERTFRKSFHAARLARAVAPPDAATPRLVIYSNHPSWWDGVVYVLLAKHLYPRRSVYTPVDAAMLGQYGFLSKIGAFGIEQNARRGAADFIAVSKAVLGLDNGLLVVAVQGRFADPRERPLGCGAGVAHLPDHVAGATFVPLAIEYPLWLEKQPEMLLQFGDTIDGDELAALPVAERLSRLEKALEITMDRLAASAISRDKNAFVVWLKGTMGVNPFYDAWRRARSLLQGRRFTPEHGAHE